MLNLLRLEDDSLKTEFHQASLTMMPVTKVLYEFYIYTEYWKTKDNFSTKICY